MFRNTVGYDNIYLDESLAQKVCEKCAGLPLVIRAVGKALQFTSQNLWKDSLDQLEKGKFENIADIDPQVYACVKLSIDRLTDDAKSCLFLCSLYPEDTTISIRKLILVTTGSWLVPDGESRFCAMVDSLRSSSLLLDSLDYVINLHDLIRDVARSMAVSDPKYAFSLVRWGSRLQDNADYPTRKFLQLHLEKKDICFPDRLDCPDLHGLWLICNNHIHKFRGGFFSMFANLRFLLIEGMHSSLELQFSFQPLDNLRTLILDECDIANIDQTNISFFPEKLETLCIWDCNLPVPLDLPNLRHLRKLEILEWKKDVQMMPNTISNMPSLEELHIPSGFKIRDDGSERSLDSVSAPWVEISELTQLKSLHMFFTKYEHFQDENISGNILEYFISVGMEWSSYWWHPYYSRVFAKRFILVCDCLEREGLKGLIERAEEVELIFTNIALGSIYSSNREAFADLRKLFFKGCDTMEYIARISHNEIQHYRSFSKLTSLEIVYCAVVKYLFSKSVAKSLRQLQQFSIVGCPVMEAIVMDGGTSDRDNDIINFSKLKSLKLENLPTLNCFCMEKKDMHSCSTTHNSAISEIHHRPLFDEMVAFPSLEELIVGELGDTVNDIWVKYYHENDNNKNVVSSSFSKLKSLCVKSCNKLEIAIPLAMLHRLQNLESLEIANCERLRNVFQHSSIARDLIHLKTMRVRDCYMLRDIVGGEGDEEEIADNGIIMFPELTTLHLNDMQSLTNLWYNQSGRANPLKVQFPNLVDLDVLGCREFILERIELGRDDFNCQLRTLDASCYNKIQLSCQWQHRLYNLESLTLPHYYWWHELKFQCFRRLKGLKVVESGCSTLFSLSAFESLRQLEDLEISSCNLLEEIVEDVKREEPSSTSYNKTVTLSKLKYVTLKDLPNLKSCYHGANHEWHMPALQVVTVSHCGISTLFTCSVFKTVQQLRYIGVSNCRLFENIVQDTRGDEAFHIDDKIITLPQLSGVCLEDLLNLKSFSATLSCALDMPKLHKFSLHRCPHIETFTSFKTSTTALVSVDSEWHRGEKVPDLNHYIKENCKREDKLSDRVGESSWSNKQQETHPERIGEEQCDSEA